MSVGAHVWDSPFQNLATMPKKSKFSGEAERKYLDLAAKAEFPDVRFGYKMPPKAHVLKAWFPANE